MCSVGPRSPCAHFRITPVKLPTCRLLHAPLQSPREAIDHAWWWRGSGRRGWPESVGGWDRCWLKAAAWVGTMSSESGFCIVKMSHVCVASVEQYVWQRQRRRCRGFLILWWTWHMHTTGRVIISQSCCNQLGIYSLTAVITVFSMMSRSVNFHKLSHNHKRSITFPNSLVLETDVTGRNFGWQMPTVREISMKQMKKVDNVFKVGFFISSPDHHTSKQNCLDSCYSSSLQ